MAKTVISNTEEEMLFVLARFLQESNKQFEDSPLRISVSKAEFIDGIMKLKAVQKQERAVYKNLENLERKRLIKYTKTKELGLTRKGLNQYNDMNKSITKYMLILNRLESKNMSRNIQSKLRQ